MRRFEFAEGNSNKFWEIERSSSSLTVKFGRIGANGQTQTKSFASEAAAVKEHDKLVAEKLKKGYQEVGSAPAPAAAPKPAGAPAAAGPEAKTKPAKKEKVPAEPAAAPAADAAPPAPDHSAAAPAPAPAAEATPSAGEGAPTAADEDGVHWTDALKKRVFPRRGGVDVGVRPLPPARKAWEKVKKAWSERAKRGETPQALEARLASDSPGSASVEEDAALIAGLAWAPSYEVRPELEAPLEALAASRGLSHAVKAALAALELHVGEKLSIVPGPSRQWRTNFHERGYLQGLPRLRALLAVAGDDEYAAAREAAASVRASGTAAQRAASSFLFPTEAAWAASDLSELVQHGVFPCLLSSISDPALLNGVAATWPLYENRFGVEDGDPAATLLDGCGLGAAPFLFAETPQYAGTEAQRARFAILAALGCDEAMALLVASLEQKEAQAALSEATSRQPRRAMRLLAEAAVKRGKAGDAARGLLTALVRRFPQLIGEVAPKIGPEAARVLESLRAESAEVYEDAKPEEVPEVLRAPRWAQKRAAAAPAIVESVPAVEVADCMRWASGEREDWAKRTGWGRVEHSGQEIVARRLEATVRELAECPEDLVEQVAPLTTKSFWGDYYWYSAVAAKHGLRALAFFEQRAQSDFAALLPSLLPFGAARFAPKVAEALAQRKSARAIARAWLLRHPEHAAAGLLSDALGQPGRARKQAEAALRAVAQGGHEGVILSVAERAGVKDAVAAVLAADPLDLFPAKLPKLPPFVDPASLPRPLLRARKAALPASAAEALAVMLAFSTLEEPYAGLALVKETCEPASLARFAWELFQAWMMNGAPSKESWCLTALGHLGDDACARKLAALVREWPGEAAHARAVIGLDVLAAIGSDVALMHLNGIALKVKFKGLQAKAQEKIEAIAEARGLSREELEDRLAPDLGLDGDGSMVLDFGPRQFRVGFDEQLRPYTKDADGSRLKDLPKPKQTDDAEKAAAASARWSQLKKDAKTAAGLQILRLELAMCGQRRFPAGDFLELFVQHPLVFHIVRRLVFATYDERSRVAQTFRVAEDRTLADAGDAAFELAAGAKVGIPHPLELDAAVTGKWSQVFADYELVQPFAQLGRPTFAPAEEEKRSKSLDRVKGLKLPTGKVLGLEARRWRRGAPQDAGVTCWMEKPLPDGRTVFLELEPGLYTGMLSESPEQTLGSCTIGRESSMWRRDSGDAVESLDPIVFSELVNDLERLRG